MRVLKHRHMRDDAGAVDRDVAVPPDADPDAAYPHRADRDTYVDRDGHPARESETVLTEDVVVSPWTWADVAVAVIGAALALVGIVAAARTGVDSTWFRPVTDVLDARHTALLGAIEAGTGGVLVIAGLSRWRGGAALVGMAMAVAGAFAGIETGEVARELAIEEWWAWTLTGLGVLVTILALIPRRRRVERVATPL
jgi:hypothetical protein